MYNRVKLENKTARKVGVIAYLFYFSLFLVLVVGFFGGNCLNYMIATQSTCNILGHPELSTFSTYEITSHNYWTPSLPLLKRQSTFLWKPKQMSIYNTMRFSKCL